MEDRRVLSTLNLSGMKIRKKKMEAANCTTDIRGGDVQDWNLQFLKSWPELKVSFPDIIPGIGSRLQLDVQRAGPARTLKPRSRSVLLFNYQLYLKGPTCVLFTRSVIWQSGAISHAYC